MNQEHYNHDVRTTTDKGVKVWYIRDLKAGRDIPRVFKTEKEAIRFSNKILDGYWSGR